MEQPEVEITAARVLQKLREQFGEEQEVTLQAAGFTHLEPNSKTAGYFEGKLKAYDEIIKWATAYPDVDDLSQWR